MNTFRPGDRVRIDTEAPYYAGQAGRIDAPHAQDHMPGYWLHLDGTAELVWVPAAALTAEANEVTR